MSVHKIKGGPDKSLSVHRREIGFGSENGMGVGENENRVCTYKRVRYGSGKRAASIVVVVVVANLLPKTVSDVFEFACRSSTKMKRTGSGTNGQK